VTWHPPLALCQPAFRPSTTRYCAGKTTRVPPEALWRSSPPARHPGVDLPRRASQAWRTYAVAASRSANLAG
jgi:hypothetical protein